MIAPASRSLWLTGALVVPLSALATLFPWGSAFGLAVVICLAVWDARRGVALLRSVDVTTPARVNWIQGGASSLPFALSNSARAPLLVRVFVALPGEMSEILGELCPLAAASAAVPFQAHCTPGERGRFELKTAELETGSPLQLWRVRRHARLATEVRVYPDLRQDRVSLLLARRTYGTQRQRQAGKGRDFEKLRDYLPGDSFDEIHWRASARHGRPVVKVTQLERTQQVYCLIDGSRLSARGGVLDRFVHAALGVAMAAETQGDRFGLVAFSDRIDAFVPAGSGKAHFSTCRDALYTMQPKRVSPDFEELFAYLQLHVRTRSLLLFLTALDDPLLAELFIRNAALVARRHLLMVSVPYREGARALFTGDAPSDESGVYERLAGHLEWGRLRELAAALERNGVKLSAIETGKATSEVAGQYFDVKRRQLL